jgi:hypothetical protein
MADLQNYPDLSSTLTSSKNGFSFQRTSKSSRNGFDISKDDHPFMDKPAEMPAFLFLFGLKLIPA